MESLKFTKMSGAGNDFIVMDNRDSRVSESGRESLVRTWCRRRLDIGADGVLLVEPSENSSAHFRMRYYNADGMEAETCGNGARCIARFAHEIGAAPEQMKFETAAGPYEAIILEESVILTMSDPHSLRRDVPLDLPSLPDGRLDFINTGVPHAVAFFPDVAALDVRDLGSAIRRYESFAPEGTNANFAQVCDGGTILVRTYERGVEAETLACGTGSIACALIANLKGWVASPVSIQTSGGPILRIHFERPDGSEQFSNVRLEGEARIVYEGAVPATAVPSLP